MKPLLSIVIATKNREDYCISAIKSINSINEKHIEINVADNSDSQKIKDFINDNKLLNVNYIYDPNPKSSIDNFNLAMSLATGYFVCMIGDDDAILPNIIELCHWAKDNDVDSVSCSNFIGYYWPGAYEKHPNGVLFIPKVKKKIKRINVDEKLNLLLRNGMVEFSQYSLPKTYHGIVKRERIIEIKKLTGNFFGGLSPDIYSAVSLSCVVNNHYSTTVPFTIAGVCSRSTASASIKGEHSGVLNSAPHFKYRGKYIWDSNIPQYYSISTIWSESGLKALSDLNKIELYNKFRCYRMNAQGIILNRHILPIVLNETYKWIREKKVNILHFVFYVLIEIIYLIFTKLKLEILNRLFKRRYVITDIDNIHSAIQCISKHSLNTF